MLPDILDLSADGLRAVAASAGLKPFGAGQIYTWLYQQGVTSFDEMTNVSGAARAALAAAYRVGALENVAQQEAADGTTKFLFRLFDGLQVETVMIPADRRDHGPRRTVCISTQAGCAMGCTFCRTATMGLARHLSAAEILAQVLAVRRLLVARGERLSNVVLMGMGEPLHNYDPTMQALRIMVDPKGIGLAPRRVTLSTVGLVPGIRKFATEHLGVKLALSLHATTDDVRRTLIPMAKKYPLDEIFAACRDFCRTQPRRGEVVTLEYLMLRMVNDTEADAHRLVKIAAHVPSKVNLIPLNPYPGCPWERPEEERIENFANALRAKGVQVNIRHSRGQDILAACGQLAVGNRD